MKRSNKKTVSLILSVISVVLSYILLEFYIHNPFLTMYIRFHVLNLIFFCLMFVLLLGIWGRVNTALTVQSIICLVWGTLNYYIVSFRGSPILPWDIYSVKTAVSVAGNYNYIPEAKVILILILYILLILTQVFFISNKKINKKSRIMWILISCILLFGYVETVQNHDFIKKYGLYDKLFTPTSMLIRDGTAVAFIMQSEYLSVDKPSGYNKEIQTQIYEELEKESEQQITEYLKYDTDMPNIIVIMNEAFSDLKVLGDFETNIDYMPFTHSLMEGNDNTVSGYLNVSVLGGNTADTEYEFLTGSSMRFLPSGCIPYQQYIKDETVSLASYLRELGYDTSAIHPYKKTGWDRDKVYPLLGFKNFYDQDTFENPRLIREYISDESSYDKIISLYENKSDAPLFIFNVTMQNHGGYGEDYDNFESDVFMKAAPLDALSQYLSLVKASDEAFEGLINYFENADENTMIVMFGDHQPATNISNPILKLNGYNPSNIISIKNLDRYKVPYVIWANFDIEEEKGKETSANYLSIDILEKCEIPLSPYQMFVKEYKDMYPVITSMQVTEVNGKIYDSEDIDRELNEYEKMAYYLLFDN